MFGDILSDLIAGQGVANLTAMLLSGSSGDCHQRCPEAVCAVAGRQLGRDGQAASLERDQQFAPAWMHEI
jgi:hypothetical protein